MSDEVRAGLTTFLSTAYIAVVNPPLLAAAHIPISAAITATCLGVGIMNVIMGLLSNLPIACASGMGSNIVAVCLLSENAGGDWRTAMAVIFVEGLAILFLVLSGAYRTVMDAIPPSLRCSISIGVGIMIAMVGLANADIIALGDWSAASTAHGVDSRAIVGLISIAATLVFFSIGFKGALLLGSFVAVIAGIPLGVTIMPSSIISAPDLSAFGAPFLMDSQGLIGIVKAMRLPILMAFAPAFLMSDLLNALGSTTAIGRAGEFLGDDGSIKHLRRILAIDSIAIAVGGFMEASTISISAESIAGATDGGRTGVSSVIVGMLFVLSSFFAPLISIINPATTCGALVLAGFLMAREAQKIAWFNLHEGFPAFAIIVGTTLTHSLASGIGMGCISFSLIAVFAGRSKKVKPFMWVAVAVFSAYFLIAK